MRMNLRFFESEISDLANQYTECQRESNRVREEYLIGLKSRVQERGCLIQGELYELARWKSPRRATLTLENTSAFIEEITERAFTATDNWTKLRTLTKLQGVGSPTASAILHLYDEGESPNDEGGYPILDIPHFGLSDCHGKKGTPTPSGWNTLSFAATSRT